MSNYSYYFLLTLLVAVLSANSQGFDSDKELGNIINRSLPNSPEAEAFTKYGDYSVSMYTGTPNIEVPIYTYEGIELDLPISLTYDASGIKVNQLATKVGLGWNLNVGGRVSRMMNGNPDDFHTASPPYVSFFDDVQVQMEMLDYLDNNQEFSSHQAALDYLTFLYDVNRQYKETQPDYFSVNALGFNDLAVIDISSLEAKALNNPRIDINYQLDAGTQSISGWTVTTDDGTVFKFDAAELTQVSSSDIQGVIGVNKTYASSWLLTSVKSKNRKDQYTFHYTDPAWWSQPQQLTVAQSERNDVNDLNHSDNHYLANSIPTANAEYQIKQPLLQTIKWNGQTVVSFDLEDRQDLDIASAIGAIHIHRRGGEIFRSFDLVHSYFGIADSPNSEEKRLKLDSINSYSGNGQIFQQYAFDYINSDGVPSLSSYARDYLGMYNGENGNTVLIPSMQLGGDTYAGGDRSFSFTDAQAGILNRITYPTGGYTTFEYGPHTSPNRASDVIQQEVKVTYATLNLEGGSDPAQTCPGFCMDQYMAFETPPKVATTTFSSPGGFLFDVEYLFSGSPADQFGGDAYLLYLGPSSEIMYPTSPIKPMLNSPVSYTQLIDSIGSSSMIWTNAAGNQSVNLPAGEYQLLLVNAVPGTSSLVKVSRNETTQIGNIGEGSIHRGGIRINAINNFLSEGELATRKLYRYTENMTENTSSGQMIDDPTKRLKYFVQEAVLIQPGSDAVNYGMNTGINSKSVAVRSSSSPSSRPYVVYPKVYEIQSSSEGGAPIGYKSYLFHSGSSGITSFGGANNYNYYIQDTKVGKPYQIESFDQEHDVVQKQLIEYDQYSYYLNKGIFVGRNGANSLKYPIIKPFAGNYIIEFSDPSLIGGIVVDGFGNHNLSTVSPIVAFETVCNEAYYPGTIIPCLGCDEMCTNWTSYCNYYPDTQCPNTQEYSALSFNYTSAEGEVGESQASVSIDYFLLDSVYNYTSTVYDESIGFLPRESKIITSLDTDTIRTINYYPADGVTPGSDLLESKHRLVEVTSNQTFKNEILLDNREVSYSSFGPHALMPTTIQTAKGDQELEDRLVLDYDASGILVQSALPGGKSTSYIHGYDNKRIIAKLDNVEYNEIIGNVGLLKFLSSSGGNDSILVDSLNGLRISNPQSMISTFTYDLFAGPASITDPRGNAVHHVYDEFGRLIKSMDHNGNIIQEHEYHYARVPDAEYDALGAQIIHGTVSAENQVFISEVTGGSGDFNFEWFKGNSPVSFDINPVGSFANYQMSILCSDTKYAKLVVTDNVTGESTEAILESADVACPPFIVNVTYGAKTNMSQVFNTSFSGAVGGVTYQWYKGIGTSSNSFSPSIKSSQPSYNMPISCSSFAYSKLIAEDEAGRSVVKITRSNNDPCLGPIGGGPINEPQH